MVTNTTNSGAKSFLALLLNICNFLSIPRQLIVRPGFLRSLPSGQLTSYSGWAIGSTFQTNHFGTFAIFKYLFIVLVLGFLVQCNLSTVFDNHRKSLIQHCYAYILSGQKLIKNAKNGQFFENLKLAVKQCYQTGQF